MQSATAFPETLKRQRSARRMSQLELALDADISARHLSFLETGRARPGRATVLALADALVLPLGMRNALLLAAGFAPAFPASALDSAALGPFRAVLDEMMARHAPNPALLCDRHWNVLDANPAATALLAALGDIGDAPNVVRMLTDGTGTAAILNLPEVIAEMRGRLALERLEAPDDPVLAALTAGLDRAAIGNDPAAPTTRSPIVPLKLAAPGGALSFLSVIAHFGTSEDVTVRDLRLELLFPADDATRAAMAELAIS